ncbi:MAG: hypothetical protein II739_03340, partial [Clostridia bacterium]|nr:hypothetical protein [Clostridia bacterium]
EDGSFGQVRAVVNSIILSYVKPEPDPTEEPTAEPVPTDAPVVTPEPAPKKGCGSAVTTVIPLLAAVPVALLIRKKKETLR